MESTESARSRTRSVLPSLSALALALAVCFETGGPVQPPKCPGIDPQLCDPPPA